MIRIIFRSFSVLLLGVLVWGCVPINTFTVEPSIIPSSIVTITPSPLSTLDATLPPTSTSTQIPTPTPIPTSTPTATAFPIRVAVDTNLPPFVTYDRTNNLLTGFNIDLFKTIALKQNLQVYFINAAHDKILDGIKTCEFDSAISLFTPTEEDKKTLLFSDPYLQTNLVILVQKNNKTIVTKNDLTRKKIGIMALSSGLDALNSIKNAEIIDYTSVELLIEDLFVSKINAVIINLPSAAYYVKSRPQDFSILNENIADELFTIAVCKNKPELLELINKGLSEAKTEYLITLLEQKWFALTPSHIPTEKP
jgi:ABC-type amino acid transport substrate-binding protein